MGTNQLIFSAQDPCTLVVGGQNVPPKTKKNLCPEPASKLYWPSDRRLSAMLMPTFENRGCHMVSITDLYGHILGFLDQSCYFYFK
jgi:hypothetical protein